MKKITLIPLVLAVSLLAGCETNSPYANFRNHTEKFLYDGAVRPVHQGTSWGRGNFRNQMADHVVRPKSHMANPYRKGAKKQHYRSGNLPRYHVTSEEQAKYHELNDRLQNRMSNIRKQDVKNEAINNSSTLPTIPVSNGGAAPK